MTGPADPFGQFAEAATGLHELFQSYVEAGFKRTEAFELVRTMLAESVRARHGGGPKQ